MSRYKKRATTERVSDQLGRTRVSITGSNAGVSATLYTVTAGKTFYMETLNAGSLVSVLAVAHMSIRDNGAGGTIKVKSIPTISINTNCSLNYSNPTDPIPFTIDVRMQIDAGTFALLSTWTLTGYEE